MPLVGNHMPHNLVIAGLTVMHCLNILVAIPRLPVMSHPNRPHTLTLRSLVMVVKCRVL